MKVLMVTGAYAPEISSGGLQAQLMARALQGRADIRVLTTAVDPAVPVRSNVDGIDVTRIHVRVGDRLSELRASWRMCRQLFRLARWADVIHVHGVSKKNVPVAAIARLARRPLVLSLHTMGFDQPAMVRKHGALAWWAFRSAARYLAVSPALRDAMSEAGVPDDRVELLPNGIDTDRFRPASAEEKRRLKRAAGLDAEAPVILFVGFFSHDKQPRVVFDAWMRLLNDHAIDATVCFVGATKSDYHEVDAAIADGMRRDAAARSRSSRLVFTGTVHDVERHFQLADVFVLPSRREGLPVALMEAMACALPCVASHLPGATDTLIDHGVSGLLVPVGDVPAFASAITDMLTDSRRAAAMGAAARQVILDRFASDAIAARWLDCYRLCAGNV